MSARMRFSASSSPARKASLIFILPFLPGLTCQIHKPIGVRLADFPLVFGLHPLELLHDPTNHLTFGLGECVEVCKKRL
jgi:hypothetical protein